MRELLPVEIKKAFKNKWFLFVSLIGFLCTLLSFVYQVSVYMHGLEPTLIKAEHGQNPFIFVDTVFNHWVGGEGYSLGTIAFFFLFPLICCLAYGWSYSEERLSGYDKLVIARVGRKAYFRSKLLATGLAGGAAFILPQILNFVMVLCVIPMRKTYIEGDIYYGVFSGNLLSGLFYTQPLLYVFAFWCIDFAFCALTAMTCVLLCDLIRKVWIPVLVPFVFYMVCYQLEGFAHRLIPRSVHMGLSPFYFLRGSIYQKELNGFPVALWFLFLAVVLGIYLTLIRRRDVI